MITRREALLSVSALALAGPLAARASSPADVVRARPAPLSAVRLTPSIFHTAVETNGRYLLSLEPARLLHNFHKSAGLPVQGEVYGGWEARGIAGHTLGHYLSACSLMYAQTGDTAFQARVSDIVAELAHCQAAHGDGYVGGTTVERDGVVVDGKVVFEEVRQGDIRTGGFDVNGGWVPLYTWHKVHAGLIDAYQLCENEQALTVMLGMANYLASILEGLDETQMQALLVAEHGGLNDTYAQTYALTGEQRWLDLAERIRHREALDPMVEERNTLPGLHANTQIPKVIGLAQLYEATGTQEHAAAARFFHETVTRHHSYAIGGNAYGEFFREPDEIAGALSDRTCESCNSYNMLKLTRQIYSWSLDARLFDYYEHAHLNHIMAHQHPETGMFAYFMPLASGSRRTFSTPENSFWCCVGSGMESHAKHGDSIYWRSDDALFVNLYIPSELDWAEAGWRLALETDFPESERVTLTVGAAPEGESTLALRLPGWCAAPRLALNGEPVGIPDTDGYARLTRTWRVGDVITLSLPMALRIETAPDDASVVTYHHGPLVLAGDLGPASDRLDALAPAFVAKAPSTASARTDVFANYQLDETAPVAVTLKPFFSQYDRRTAVYFPTLTKEKWDMMEADHLADQREQSELRKRTIDHIDLGEVDDERAHAFHTNHSDHIANGGQNGRQAWWGAGNYIAFDLAVTAEPMALHVLYWGEEVDKDFEIHVDGALLAVESRAQEPSPGFVGVEYPLPEDLTADKEHITVRFETKVTDAPIYEARTVRLA